jgi:hypothetical protein
MRIVHNYLALTKKRNVTSYCDTAKHRPLCGNGSMNKQAVARQQPADTSHNKGAGGGVFYTVRQKAIQLGRAVSVMSKTQQA